MSRSPSVAGRLRVTPTCVIRLDELEWRTTGSGGPGGQHANTSDTRVEVRFHVATSPSLGPRQRARLLERLGPGGRGPPRPTPARRRATASSRSSGSGRGSPTALRVDPPRRATKPTPLGEARPASTPSGASRQRKRDRRRRLDRTTSSASLRSCTADGRASSRSCGSRSGVGLLFLVIDSAVRTFVLPRGAAPLVTRGRVHRPADGVQRHRPRSPAATTVATR